MTAQAPAPINDATVQYRDGICYVQRKNDRQRLEWEEADWYPLRTSDEEPGFQERCLSAGETEILVGGAKGPGKSELIVARPLQQIHHRHYKALILRESGPDRELKEVLRRAHELYPKFGGKWHGQANEFRFPRGAVVAVGDCPDLQSVTKYQGHEWAEILYDEVGDLRDENVWTSLSKEVRCKDPLVKRGMFASANPGGSGHGWIVRRFIKPTENGRKVYRETVRTAAGVSVRTRRYIPGKVTDNPIYARDPAYLATLLSLPEVMRRQLLDGDWMAGLGTALDEMTEARHIVKPFQVPDYWIQFGAFDWGFAHWWVFGHYAVSEDGKIYKLDTVYGRGHKDHEIIDRIKRRVPVQKLKYIAAGHDVWADKHKDGTPTTAERFRLQGITMSPANISRVSGFTNLLAYHAWKGMRLTETGDREDDEPMLQFFDTPGNRECFHRLEQIIRDPSDMEDTLKVDCDPLTGDGGDDFYDETRYGVASRPPRPRTSAMEVAIKAWAPATLAHEAVEQRKVSTKRSKAGKPLGKTRIHGV